MSENSNLVQLPKAKWWALFIECSKALLSIYSGVGAREAYQRLRHIAATALGASVRKAGMNTT